MNQKMSQKLGRKCGRKKGVKNKYRGASRRRERGRMRRVGGTGWGPKSMTKVTYLTWEVSKDLEEHFARRSRLAQVQGAADMMASPIPPTPFA